MILSETKMERGDIEAMSSVELSMWLKKMGCRIAIVNYSKVKIPV